MNIKSNLTTKIEYTLKSSNYDAKPWFFHFTAQNSNVHAVFERQEPEILQTCWVCPCRAFHDFFCFCFFSLERWYLNKTQKITKTQTPGWKKQKPKTPLVKVSAGAHQTRVQNFRVLPLKNGLDIRLWRNLGFYAWTNLYLKHLGREDVPNAQFLLEICVLRREVPCSWHQDEEHTTVAVESA